MNEREVRKRTRSQEGLASAHRASHGLLRSPRRRRHDNCRTSHIRTDGPGSATRRPRAQRNKVVHGAKSPNGKGQAMNTEASQIYTQLQTLYRQLEQLNQQGRTVMARDSLNIDFPDSKRATATALQGIEQAINAICWMETLTNTDGIYPPLRE